MPPPPLIIIKRQFHILNEQIINGYPNETGGFFAGKNNIILGVFPIANRRDSASGAQTTFSINEDDIYFAQKFFKDNQLNIMGMYHSHPNGLPIPSAKDMTHLVGNAFGRHHMIIAIKPHNQLKKKFNVSRNEPAYQIRLGLYYCPSHREKIPIELKIIENNRINEYLLTAGEGNLADNKTLSEYLKLEEKIAQLITQGKINYKKEIHQTPVNSFNIDT